MNVLYKKKKIIIINFLTLLFLVGCVRDMEESGQLNNNLNSEVVSEEEYISDNSINNEFLMNEEANVDVDIVEEDILEYIPTANGEEDILEYIPTANGEEAVAELIDWFERGPGDHSQSFISLMRWLENKGYTYEDARYALNYLTNEKILRGIIETDISVKEMWDSFQSDVMVVELDDGNNTLILLNKELEIVKTLNNGLNCVEGYRNNIGLFWNSGICILDSEGNNINDLYFDEVDEFITYTVNSNGEYVFWFKTCEEEYGDNGIEYYWYIKAVDKKGELINLWTYEEFEGISEKEFLGNVRIEDVGYDCCKIIWGQNSYDISYVVDLRSDVLSLDRGILFEINFDDSVFCDGNGYYIASNGIVKAYTKEGNERFEIKGYECVFVGNKIVSINKDASRCEIYDTNGILIYVLEESLIEQLMEYPQNYIGTEYCTKIEFYSESNTKYYSIYDNEGNCLVKPQKEEIILTDYLSTCDLYYTNDLEIGWCLKDMESGKILFDAPDNYGESDISSFSGKFVYISENGTICAIGY